MLPHWNLPLVVNLKAFFFDAGLPFCLLLICATFFLFGIITTLLRWFFLMSLCLLLFFCNVYSVQVLSHFLFSEPDRALEQHVLPAQPATLITHPGCSLEPFVPIVVLGAGNSYFGTPSPAGMSRVLGLVALLHNRLEHRVLHSASVPIVFSGGFTDTRVLHSEAFFMEDFFHHWQPPGLWPVIKEESSKNTYENSYYVKQALPSYDKIILITNSYHMARAQKTFEARGFRVCPVSVASQLDTGVLFSFGYARSVAILLNEYVGFLGYFLKGWLFSWRP